MPKLRIGIVGTGGMANGHAGEFKKIKGVEVAGCFDVVPERAQQFAQKHKIPHAAKSLDELIDEVDAISVVTSDRAHAPISLKALAAGKHLLCEKPLTVTLEEARQVARAAAAAQKKAGVIHMVQFSYRRSAALQEAMKIARSGFLGEIRHVNSRYLQSWLTTPGWTGEWALWRSSVRHGGGTLADIGCHILDFTTAIVGDLASVRCSMANFPKLDYKGRHYTRYKGYRLDANDTVLIEMRFACGAFGVCQATRWATGRGNTVAVEVYGTHGALAINLDEGYDKLMLCDNKGGKTNAWKPEWITRTIKPTPNIFQRFVRAIRTGKPDQPDVLRGAQVQAYLDACTRSAASGKAQRVRRWM